MTTQKVTGIAILFLAVAFTVQMVQQNGASAQQQQTRQLNGATATANAVSVEYARLVIEDDEDNVTWLVGGNDRVRTESLSRTFRRLGGNASRIDLANLLDQIGSQGWTLVQRVGNEWIFMRRAS